MEAAPRIKVKVSAELIDDSKRRDSSHCMIAEAVKASYPGATRVSVDLQTIRFTDMKKGRRYTYLTPRLGQVALVNFDQGTTPEPFAFQLRHGQVTAAGSRQKRAGLLEEEQQRIDATNSEEKKPKTMTVTEKVKAANTGNLKKADEARKALKKAALQKGKEVERGKAPAKIGGKTPPTSSFARRREFGLRALSR